MDKQEAYIKITRLGNSNMQVSMQGMTLLELMAASMLLMDKVYDRLKQQDNLEMAELVGSVLGTISSLVLLASDNNKGN